MRILFFVHTLGRTRHFKNVLRDLVTRGHHIVLATVNAGDASKAAGFYDQPGIEIVVCPGARADRWGPLVEPMRLARDHIRYRHPRYAHADKLEARAARFAPRAWLRMLERHPSLLRRWRVLPRSLSLAETVIPADAGFSAFIARHAPDVVLVTPLIEFGSYQTDYVKSAHALGIPVGFLPFSWDNLTNRGLIRVAPDRVLVWNEFQQREAVELHDVPPDRVVITGAPRFDQFFEMTASTAREEFFTDLGLDPARQLVLYLCSAPFIAPVEVPFVRQWIGELRRRHRAPWLREAAVLIRPHPAHREEWDAADLSDLPQVVIWPHRSPLNADQRLFDSLTHSTAVAGLNTSAMIESAIVGRPVFTMTPPEFAGGQEGTLHFWYLLTEHGGVVSTSNSFDEHFAQVADASGDTDTTRVRSQAFVERFVRPCGYRTPASGVMADEIEQLGALPKRALTARWWHDPVRWSLEAALRLGLDRNLFDVRLSAS